MRNISRSEDRLSWELVEWAERSECGVWCWVFGVHFGVSLLLLLTEEQTQRERYPEMKKGSNVEWSEMQGLCLTEDEGDSEQRKM